MEVVEFVDPAKRSGRNGDYKRNRKLFMSSKTSDVLRDTSTKKETSKSDDEEEFDFDGIFKKVEKLVADSHSTWKEKKAAQQQRAESLGAKPVKNFKQPVDMGVALSKKRKAREEAQKQQDIAAGNYVKQDKKPRKDKKLEDRELQVGGGKFRGGVLYVKPPVKASEHMERLQNKGLRPKSKGFKPKNKGFNKRKGGGKPKRK